MWCCGALCSDAMHCDVVEALFNRAALCWCAGCCLMVPVLVRWWCLDQACLAVAGLCAPPFFLLV
eukprot:54258-Rhodomonas_salina.1